MRNISLLFIAILSIFSCTTKSGTDEKSVSPFSGNWLSLTYQDSLNKYGTPAKARNAELLELIINFSADSMCLNVEGVETPVFKIDDKKEKSFCVKKFNQDEYTEFIISGNGKELSYEYKKYNQKIHFFKAEQKYAVKIINGWSSAAQLYFNERTIAANFYRLDKDGNRMAEVAFTSYGKVVGLQGYSDFSVCYQGDCRSMCDEDLITLSDGASSDNFIYEWGNGMLIFYSVSNIASRDEKPQYVKAEEIFRFTKRM
jgi:hypothetical protein